MIGLKTVFQFHQVLMALVLLSGAPVLASIPRATFIMEKVSNNAGSGSYQIEQDVVFQGTTESLTLREVWTVESDSLMKVNVSGPKELQDAIKMQFIYNGGQRSFNSSQGRKNSRVGEDFFERYFHFRTRETLFKALVQDKILPTSWPTSKPGKSTKDFVHVQEPISKLARTGGVITYQLGAAPKSERDMNPALWVEQDVFNIRKLRLPSQVEVKADNYASYPRGLHLPRQRTLRWNQKVVQINLVRVTPNKASKGAPFFQPNASDPAYRVGGIKDPEIAKTIEEFYQRFR